MYTYKFMYIVENSGLPGFKFNVKVNKITFGFYLMTQLSFRMAARYNY